MDLRDSALAILHAALAAADPRAAVRRTLLVEGDLLRVGTRAYDLTRIARVFVIGFGKAGAAMAAAVEQVLGKRIERGWVSVKYGYVTRLARVHLHEAGHPLPDANSVLGAQQILDLLDTTTAQDLVICLISGGGSAILELPVAGVTLDDLRVMTDVLLRCGATIDEINTLRRHLSQVKGGQLARRSHAPLISLILSDVVGSPLETIASGPTVPDATTYSDAWNVIERRGIRDELPASIVRHIEREAAREAHQTSGATSANDPAFERVQNVLVADNATACQAALRHAQALGLDSLLLSTFIQGEARQVAQVLIAIAREIVAFDRPVPRPACIIAGGETTVTIRGSGKGGRNQELALAAAIEMGNLGAGPNGSRLLLLSAGTDGSDGPTDAAGALADETTLARAAARGLDARAYLANNDAYHFFEPLGDLVITGPTNTNVNDIMLLLVE